MLRRILKWLGALFFATLWCIVIALGVVILWVIQVACVLMNKKRPLDAFLDAMDEVLQGLKLEA